MCCEVQSDAEGRTSYLRGRQHVADAAAHRVAEEALKALREAGIPLAAIYLGVWHRRARAVVAPLNATLILDRARLPEILGTNLDGEAPPARPDDPTCVPGIPLRRVHGPGLAGWRPAGRSVVCGHGGFGVAGIG